MHFVSRVVGWGVVIYAIMYLLWQGMAIYGLSYGFSALVVRLVVLAAVATIATRSLRLKALVDIAPYAIGWVVVAMALDAIFLMPFVGWGLYTEWSVWLGYVLLAVIPLAPFAAELSPLFMSRKARSR